MAYMVITPETYSQVGLLKELKSDIAASKGTLWLV